MATLAESRVSSHVTISFGPSYISKSRKYVPYLSGICSGCAKKAKHGPEISGIVIIDRDLYACFHLEAVQTPPVKTASGYVSENARYRAVRCEGCPLRCRCFKAKGNRTIELTQA